MLRTLTRPSASLVGAAATIVFAAAASCVEAQSGPPPDSARLLRDLSVLAHDSMEGRAPGTRGSLRARAFLRDALAGTGALPVGAAYDRPFSWNAGRGVNFVARIPGRGEDDDVIFLTAHYDHLGVRNGEIYNGADDNASGTAAVLEIARTVVASPLDHTLMVALLDAEEEGELGAEALLEDPPVPLERIALDVNLDMVSRTSGVLWASGTAHTPALRPVLEAVAARRPRGAPSRPRPARGSRGRRLDPLLGPLGLSRAAGSRSCTSASRIIPTTTDRPTISSAWIPASTWRPSARS